MISDAKSLGKSENGGNSLEQGPTNLMTAIRSSFIGSLSTTALIKCVVPIVTEQISSDLISGFEAVNFSNKPSRDFFIPDVTSLVVGVFSKAIIPQFFSSFKFEGFIITESVLVPPTSIPITYLLVFIVLLFLVHRNMKFKVLQLKRISIWV